MYLLAYAFKHTTWYTYLVFYEMFSHLKDEGAQVAEETRFQLIAKGEKCVVLESVKEYEKCVGVREDGTLMPASHCSAVDEHAKFYVYLVVSFR